MAASGPGARWRRLPVIEVIELENAGGTMGDDTDTRHDRWARLRFAVVGPLLAAPPARGELVVELARLAVKVWRHPVTGEPIRFGRSTIERWLAAARREQRDPVGVLRRRVRKDAGQARGVSLALGEAIRAQHREHPGWSYQLHADNLLVLV